MDSRALSTLRYTPGDSILKDVLSTELELKGLAVILMSIIKHWEIEDEYGFCLTIRDPCIPHDGWKNEIIQKAFDDLNIYSEGPDDDVAICIYIDDGWFRMDIFRYVHEEQHEIEEYDDLTKDEMTNILLEMMIEDVIIYDNWTDIQIEY